MSSAEEVAAAVSGAARAGLPIAATLTFDTHGRTMMGVTTADAVRLFDGLPVRPVAFGANCGNGHAQLPDSVVGLPAAAGGSDERRGGKECGSTGGSRVCH